MAFTVTPTGFIEDCRKGGVNAPHQIAAASLGYLAHVMASEFDTHSGLARQLMGAELALTLSALHPDAAGWLLEELSIARPVLDRNIREGAHFIDAVIQELRESALAEAR